MPTVSVKLGSRSYQILISAGLLDELGVRARTSLGANCRRAILVSNMTVGSIYRERSAGSLRRAGFEVHSFSIGDGE